MRTLSHYISISIAVTALALIVGCNSYRTMDSVMVFSGLYESLVFKEDGSFYRIGDGGYIYDQGRWEYTSHSNDLAIQVLSANWYPSLALGFAVLHVGNERVAHRIDDAMSVLDDFLHYEGNTTNEVSGDFIDHMFAVEFQRPDKGSIFLSPFGYNTVESLIKNEQLRDAIIAYRAYRERRHEGACYNILIVLDSGRRLKVKESNIVYSREHNSTITMIP